MKIMNLTFLLLLSISPSAFADLKFQMEHIVGLWDIGENYALMKIQRQSDHAILIRICERDQWLINGSCTTIHTLIYNYDASYDGFFRAGDPEFPRGYGLQVSRGAPDQLLYTFDPLGIYTDKIDESGQIFIGTRK